MKAEALVQVSESEMLVVAVDALSLGVEESRNRVAWDLSSNLMAAAASRDIILMKRLVEDGANVNSRCLVGRTILMRLAMCSCLGNSPDETLRVFQVLLEAGVSSSD